MSTKKNDIQIIEDISSVDEVKNELDKSGHENVLAHPFQFLIPDSFLYPGFKVRDKLSGLEMLVIGFTFDSGLVTEEHQFSTSHYFYEKVYCNILKKSDFELFGGEEDRKSYYHYFSNLLHSWEEREQVDDDLYFVCKYWNLETDKFRYSIKKIYEFDSI